MAECEWMDCFSQLQLPKAIGDNGTRWRLIVEATWNLPMSSEENGTSWFRLIHGEEKKGAGGYWYGKEWSALDQWSVRYFRYSTTPSKQSRNNSSFKGPNPTKDDGTSLPRVIQFDSQLDSHTLTIHYHSEGTSFKDQPLPLFPLSNNPDTNRRLSLSYQWLPDCESECTSSPLQPRKLDTSLLQPGEWAVLESPGYPHPYCNRLSCDWEIMAPDGYRVGLAMRDLATEPGRDMLTVSKSLIYQGDEQRLVSSVR